jgi:hypothetical protein
LSLENDSDEASADEMAPEIPPETLRREPRKLTANITRKNTGGLEKSSTGKETSRALPELPKRTVETSISGGSRAPQLQPKQDHRSQGGFLSYFTGRQETEYERAVREQVAKEIRPWDEACKQRDSVIQNQRLKIRALENEKSSLLQKNADLQDHLQDQEKVVAAAQSKALEMLDQAEWTPQEDSKVKQELNALEKAIRTWSKNCAIDSLHGWKLDRLTAEDLASIRYYWEPFALLPTKGLPIPMGFEDGSMDSKVWMLLAAWLTSHIYSQVFRDPFFFMEEFMEELYIVKRPEKVRQTEQMDRDLTDILAQLQEGEFAIV